MVIQIYISLFPFNNMLYKLIFHFMYSKRRTKSPVKHFHKIWSIDSSSRVQKLVVYQLNIRESINNFIINFFLFLQYQLKVLEIEIFLKKFFYIISLQCYRYGTASGDLYHHVIVFKDERKI